MIRDEDLAVQVGKGDESALEELVHRYEHRLFSYLRRLGTGPDAEDLYQQTWIRVVQASGRFDPNRRFSTWLFQIATNLARDRARRRGRRPEVSLEEGRPQASPFSGDQSVGTDGDRRDDVSTNTETSSETLQPGDGFPAVSRDPLHASNDTSTAASTRVDAQRLLEALGDDQRSVVVLRYLQDMSEAQTAQVLGIPRGTVKSRLHLALKKLAEFAGRYPS